MRKRSSIKSFFLAMTLTIGGIALVAAILLVSINRTFEAAITVMDREAESIRSAAGVRLALYMFSRDSLLWASLEDPTYAESRERARAMTFEGLNLARQNVTEPADDERLSEIEARVRTYFARRDELLRPEIRPSEQVALATPSFNAAVDALNRYVETSRESGGKAQRRVLRLNHQETDVSIVMLVLLPLAMGWLVYAARRDVFLPFQSALRALSNYSAGDTRARAPDVGPAELRAMAGAFNGLAVSLERQGQIRLDSLLAVAHDLRNPLAALRATVELAERRLHGGPFTAEQMATTIRRVSKQVARLNRMIDDLVDVTRIEAGRVELQWGRCDLREVANEAKELYDDASPLHSIVVRIPEEPVMVRGDETRLGQVLGNLVTNAIRYSPDGGEVEVTVTSTPAHAVLEVKDHGIGIAPADQETIFQAFQRLHVGGAPGVGLGLAVVKRLVVAHGGRVEVESQLGVGSTFRVFLPLDVGGAPLANA